MITGHTCKLDSSSGKRNAEVAVVSCYSHLSAKQYAASMVVIAKGLRLSFLLRSDNGDFDKIDAGCDQTGGNPRSCMSGL